jgi:hypothetical protein
MFVYLILQDQRAIYINSNNIITIEDCIEHNEDYPTYIGSKVTVNMGTGDPVVYKTINMSNNILDQIRRITNE